MTSRGDIDAEAWVLTTSEGQSLLGAVALVRSPGPAEILRWRRQADLEQVNAAIRLAEARVRGASKFSRASRMWLEKIGLEQATSEIVANHKAKRFHGETVVDLCSGIGGDSIALAAKSRVIAVDSDHGMCRRLHWNAEVYEVADRIDAVEAKAEQFAIPTGAMIHIDPDRRQGASRRAIRLEDYRPRIDTFLNRVDRLSGAIKLGPASDFDSLPPSGFEIELISLNGECKEATLWFGDLVTCDRRATCLPEGASWTDRDGALDLEAAVGPVDRWVFDPDPALRRAGLVGGFARVHGLKQFMSGVSYLTGPEFVESPFLTGFEVVGVYRLDMATLKREVAQREIGTLEIKVRGLELKPEAVRLALKPRGKFSATLLLAGSRDGGMAILANRRPDLSPTNAAIAHPGSDRAGRDSCRATPETDT